MTTTNQPTKKFQQLMTQVSKYSTLEFAILGKEHRINQGSWSEIILGDDGYYWLTDLKHASQLVKMGYEYAE